MWTRVSPTPDVIQTQSIQHLMSAYDSTPRLLVASVSYVRRGSLFNIGIDSALTKHSQWTYWFRYVYLQTGVVTSGPSLTHTFRTFSPRLYSRFWSHSLPRQKAGKKQKLKSCWQMIGPKAKPHTPKVQDAWPCEPWLPKPPLLHLAHSWPFSWPQKTTHFLEGLPCIHLLTLGL